MGQNYYLRSEYRPRTLTVGDLRAALAVLDPDLPVVFRTPRNGAFGSCLEYALEGLATEEYPRIETPVPASSYIDDETGETIECEAHTEVCEAWTGVVLL